MRGKYRFLELSDFLSLIKIIEPTLHIYKKAQKPTDSKE